MKIKELLNQFVKTYLAIVWPKNSNLNLIDEKKYAAFGLKNLGIVSSVYVFFYFLFYLIKFSSYQKYNEGVVAKLEAQGSSKVLNVLNTYPGNMLYIFLTLLIFLVAMGLVNLLLHKILETNKFELKSIFSLSINSSAAAFAVFPLVLIFNSIVPIGENMGNVGASFLVIFWMIFITFSFIASARVYILDSGLMFGQPKRRAFLVWGLPYLYIVKFLYDVIFNK